MDIDFLQTVPFLKKVSSEDLVDLLPLFVRSEHSPGELILKEGALTDRLYLVSRGVVHVRRSAAEKEVLLARIPRGGFFGEMNLFGAGEATASIFAMDTVWVESIEYSEFKAFMEQHPVAGYQILAYLLAETSQRLRLTNDRFVNSVYWATAKKP